MKHSTFNYVRSCRQRHALTEEELAFLINQRNRTSVSMIETGDRLPSFETSLALQVVFGMAPKALFTELYEHVEDGVMRRAHTLYERLEHDQDPRSKAKLALLEDMAKRHDETTIDV